MSCLQSVFSTSLLAKEVAVAGEMLCTSVEERSMLFTGTLPPVSFRCKVPKVSSLLFRHTSIKETANSLTLTNILHVFLSNRTG